MRAAFAIAFCLMAAPAVFAAEPQITGNPSDLAEYVTAIPRTVTITGESEVKVQADEARVSLTVHSEHKTMEGALKQNEALRNTIVQLLTQRGLPADSTRAAKFSSTPRSGMFSDKVKSYVVENTVKITVHSEKEFKAVASVVDTLPDVHYLSIEVEPTDQEGAKAKALAKACDNANAQRKLFEEKFGIKLSAQGITEGISTAQVRRRGGAGGGGGGGGGAVGTVMPSGMQSGGYLPAVQEAPESFGELLYTASVSVEHAVGK